MDALYERSAQTWRHLFDAAAVGAAATWGGFFATAVHARPIDPSAMLTIVSTTGLAAGSIVTLAPNRRLVLTNVSLLLFPAVLVLLLSDGEGAAALAALFAVYYGFVIVGSGPVRGQVLPFA